MILLTLAIANDWILTVKPLGFLILAYIASTGIWMVHGIITTLGLLDLARKYPPPEQDPISSGIRVEDDGDDSINPGLLPAAQSLFHAVLIGRPQQLQSVLVPMHQQQQQLQQLQRIYPAGPPPPPPSIHHRPEWPTVTVFISVYGVAKVLVMSAIALPLFFARLHWTAGPPPIDSWTRPFLVATTTVTGAVQGLSMLIACGLCMGWGLTTAHLTPTQHRQLRAMALLGTAVGFLTHMFPHYAPLISLFSLMVQHRSYTVAIRRTMSDLMLLLNPATGTLALPAIVHARSLPAIHTKLRWIDDLYRGVSMWLLSMAVREMIGLTIMSTTLQSVPLGADPSAAWTLVLINELPDWVFCLSVAWHARLKDPVPWYTAESPRVVCLFQYSFGLAISTQKKQTVPAAELSFRRRRRQLAEIPLTELPLVDSLDRMNSSHGLFAPKAAQWSLNMAARQSRTSALDYAMVTTVYSHRPSLAIIETAADRQREALRLGKLFRECLLEPPTNNAHTLST
ncbi:hypothetical protein BC828DRAFT_390795 [Blastocladiella britannica]|nr:hypothetical protein BC828DRAFT_390795 [Blastocladiella britannica]